MHFSKHISFVKVMHGYNVIYHFNKLKEIYQIISIDAKKVWNKIWHLFMIKTFSKLEKEGNFINLFKNIHIKPYSLQYT